ncbi:uncharacterized protein TEOVI_000546400 [Trypanosoma equiperdum]|uniref:Uncharacterized protein n=2 Tax=Trypanozoon TaxID=39700 RepID=Q38BS4_TRYB2|nr:hypothetical protein, unlikely [Trypanosoma brucei brucei TREU927]EAN77746.1 hypothetical protein, unlikely [Trypanosoma brucei brucei TREU927]SCU66782.1 hypothetical protein, conserved [Trypanosoma equiperdum]
MAKGRDSTAHMREFIKRLRARSNVSESPQPQEGEAPPRYARSAITGEVRVVGQKGPLTTSFPSPHRRLLSHVENITATTTSKPEEPPLPPALQIVPDAAEWEQNTGTKQQSCREKPVNPAAKSEPRHGAKKVSKSGNASDVLERHKKR